MWMLPPRAATFAAAASHIIPGPLRGYRKLSIKVLITAPSPEGLLAGMLMERRRASAMALQRSRPLMRCAAHSAEISSQDIPHTFSV